MTPAPTGPSPGRRFLLAVVVLSLLLPSFVRLGPVPKVGVLLDPWRGVWSVAAQATLPASRQVALTGLTGEVSVEFDSRGVPHIFAMSEADAYRVMGYLVARDRLFQLELQTRAGEGTLTELLGPRLLEADRAARQLGMAWGAERKLADMDPSSVGAVAIGAYADGVNQYLDRMRPTELPFEYHLLGLQPRRWEPVHSAYLFARMGYTLASIDPAAGRLAVQGAVGAEAAEMLVPVNSPIQEPIQPNGTAGPRYAFAPLPHPGAPDREAAVLSGLLPQTRWADEAAAGDALGSNNWAVAPERTRDGHAILAGDPHLELTLPSIWYEAHVVVPGVLDVAGVTLPGAPGVVIGFNRDLAWTFTNTGGDVLDVYRETVDDAERPGHYQVDGAWRSLVVREETYRDTRGRTVAVDSVFYTHRGPMVRRDGQWYSRRWTVNEPSAEVDLFLRAGRAATVAEWLDIMAGYVAPTQNGLVAGRDGSIAIRSSGAYPIRPGDGRGDLIRDGARSDSDWLGMLPVERYPQAVRPAQGHLVSANQQPVDPRDNPSYLGADWPSPWRAMRINALLRAEPAMTPDRMRQIQTDPGSARAEAFVPYFLAAVPRHPTNEALEGAAILATWDLGYRPDNREAVLFEVAMTELARRTWDELTDSARARPVWTPESAVLLQLLTDSSSVWWDDRRTVDRRETRDEILSASLGAALDTARARYGEPRSDGWAWGRVNPANLHHLLRLPALSARHVPVTGGPSTISPMSRWGTHGASWRMVVELGAEVRAMATYPGGQSGNPASPYYLDRLPGWADGRLDSVLTPTGPGQLPRDRVVSRWTFAPEAP